MLHRPAPAPPPPPQVPPALGKWVQRLLADRYDSTLEEPVPEDMRRLLDLH